MRTLSIRASVTAWFVGLTTALLVVFSGTLWLGIRHSLYAGIDAELRTRAEGIVALCEWEEEPGRVEFELPEGFAQSLAVAADRPARGVELVTWPERRVLYLSGATLSSGRETAIDPTFEALVADTDPAQHITAARHATRSTGDGPDLRVCTVVARVPPVRATEREPEKPGFTVVARVGEDLTALEARLHDIGLVIALLGALACLATFGFGAFLSRRVVQPLQRLGEAAARVQAGEQTSMPARGHGDEIDRLAAILDGSFRSLQSALDRQVRFTADASHELRNPTSVIRTAADVALRRERSAGEYRHFLEDILATAKRMGGIIDALLLLARLDAGTAQLAMQDVDLAELARAAVEALPDEADRKRVQVGNGARSVVRGDRGLLRIAVDNLLSNAIRYSGPETLVEVAVQNGGNGRGPHGAGGEADTVSLEVRDHGFGIDDGEQARVFERFYRADGGTGDANGAGLGLSIVAAIADVHAAQCRIDSAPRTGTTVTLAFRAAGAGEASPR